MVRWSGGVASSAARRVAFLRGINVGGSRILKMDVLREVAAGAGFADVVSVGASGNLLYASRRLPGSDEKALMKALEEHLPKALVIVRSADEMHALVAKDRFAKAPTTIPDKWRFVAFLSTPSKAALPDLPAGPLTIVGRTDSEVFYTMSEPASVALAMASRLDRALGSKVTVRNWNVVRDLARRLTEADGT